MSSLPKLIFFLKFNKFHAFLDAKNKAMDPTDKDEFALKNLDCLGALFQELNATGKCEQPVSEAVNATLDNFATCMGNFLKVFVF